MSVALREAWRGRFFEDFEVGDVYEHPLGRTVTTDSMWFTLLSQNTAPIHVDHACAAQTEFDKPEERKTPFRSEYAEWTALSGLEVPHPDRPSGKIGENLTSVSISTAQSTMWMSSRRSRRARCRRRGEFPRRTSQNTSSTYFWE
jgi:hypothetical protein